jgi:hypothetical protein
VAVYTHTVRTETADSVPNLRLLEDQADKTEKGLRRMEDRAGKVGSAAGRLGGVLGRVNPALEEGARVVNDFADGLEVAGGLSGSLLRVLGPVAVAAGALGGAYLVLKQRLDAANQAMEVSAQRATTMAQLHTRVKEAALLAALATGEITQEQFNANSAAQTAADLYREQIQQQQESVRLAEQQAQAQQELFEKEQQRLQRTRERMGDEAFRESSQTELVQLKLIRDERDRLASIVDRETNALSNLQTAQERYAENLRTVSDIQTGAVTTTTQVTEAIEQQAEAVMSLSEAFEAAGFRTGPGATGLGVDLDAPFAERSAALQERVDLLQRQIEVRQRLAALQGAGAVVGPDPRAGALQAGLSGIGAGAGQAIGLLSSPTAALGALGPAGAIISGLSALGALGAQGVEDKLDQLGQQLIAGLQALPEVLLDVFPEFVVQLAEVLPDAIADAMAEVFARLLDRIPGLSAERTDDGIGLGLDTGEILSQAGDFLATSSPSAAITAGLIRRATGRSRSSSSARAATAGRLARADGATRLAISRAPTASQSQASVVVNALGVDDGTQDAFLRRFAQFTDPDTGLRGRN